MKLELQIALRSTEWHLRAPRSAAPLKHSAPLCTRWCSAGSPRSQERGPIEATMSHEPAAHSGASPRSQERGPIEAIGVLGEADSARSHLRAPRSAAPLKPLCARTARPPRCVSPRSQERGPIGRPGRDRPCSPVRARTPPHPWLAGCSLGAISGCARWVGLTLPPFFRVENSPTKTIVRFAADEPRSKFWVRGLCPKASGRLRPQSRLRERPPH